MASEGIHLHGWALTLGASSGFGEAVSLALARAGLNIFGVHLDRKATLANAERIAGQIRALGREAVFFNVNAADEEKRAEVAGQMQKTLEERGEPGSLRVLLHSLAFGTLKLYVSEPMKDAVTQAQMDMTLDVMAHSRRRSSRTSGSSPPSSRRAASRRTRSARASPTRRRSRRSPATRRSSSRRSAAIRAGG